MAGEENGQEVQSMFIGLCSEVPGKSILAFYKTIKEPQRPKSLQDPKKGVSNGIVAGPSKRYFEQQGLPSQASPRS